MPTRTWWIVGNVKWMWLIPGAAGSNCLIFGKCILRNKFVAILSVLGFMRSTRKISSVIHLLFPCMLGVLFGVYFMSMQTTDREKRVHDIYIDRTSSLPYKVSQGVNLKRVSYVYGGRIHKEKPKIWKEVYEPSGSRNNLLEVKKEIINFKCKDPTTNKLVGLGFKNEITIIKINKNRYKTSALKNE